MTRLVALVFAALTLGAAYLTVYGVGAQSLGVASSIRAGSVGNVRAQGVK